MQTSEQIKEIVKLGLEASSTRYRDLGQSVLQEVGKNQFGETILRGDLETENAVLDILKRYNLPIMVLSEEHGRVTDIHPHPTMLGTLDGIDGTIVMKEKFGIGDYGTMLAIYKGLDPTYDDWLAAGIMLHSFLPMMLLASQGEETELNIGVINGKVKRLKFTEHQSPPPVYIDRYFEANNRIARWLPHMRWVNLKSSAAHYFKVMLNNQVMLECTRKQNLELAAGYPLIKSVGGDIFTLDGKSIGHRKFLEFGQGTNGLNFVASSKPEQALNLIELFNKAVPQ